MRRSPPQLPPSNGEHCGSVDANLGQAIRLGLSSTAAEAIPLRAKLVADGGRFCNLRVETPDM